MHILHIVGARPNFMKAAPVMRALGPHGVRQTLVHTGQHYDRRMSGSILAELGLPEPHVNLGVGSGSHAEQTARVLEGVERLLVERRPDLVLVYGDVNSTVAATLAAVKLGTRVGHVEAGLRSGDRAMPEEINRLVTDRLADLLFTPSEEAGLNLAREGVPREWIRFVGNVMIDTLVRLLPAAEAAAPFRDVGLEPGGATPFALVTLHRPSNVDDASILAGWMAVLSELAADLRIVFPVHPRTRARLESIGIAKSAVTLVDPLSYLEFLGLQRHAAVVITDSGGVQEETTYLGVPCLTLRDTTERPVTITMGTNTLIGRDPERLKTETRRILSGQARKGVVPPLWDGRASERIASHVLSA